MTNVTISISISQFFRLWASPAYGVYISLLILYSRSCSSYGCFILRATRLSNTSKHLEHVYVKERLKSSLRKSYGRYGDRVKLLSSLTNVKWHYVAWPNSKTTLHRSDFIPFCDRFTELDLLLNNEKFLQNICNVACRQETLTPPDTWSRLIWALHMSYLLRPILFPNLSLFFQTMLFERHSVLSRFCFII